MKNVTQFYVSELQQYRWWWIIDDVADIKAYDIIRYLQILKHNAFDIKHTHNTTHTQHNIHTTQHTHNTTHTVVHKQQQQKQEMKQFTDEVSCEETCTIGTQVSLSLCLA